MPLEPPAQPFGDERFRLEPLRQEHVPAFAALGQDDEVARYTLLPTDADEAFFSAWIKRYEEGLADASRAGFAILLHGNVIGFAAFVQLDLATREGEIGYLVVRAARGQGAATRAVELLSAWGFDELGLERLELRINPTNTGSERVAERSGYRREGVLRSKYFKEGRRGDLGIWSRLRSDPPTAES